MDQIFYSQINWQADIVNKVRLYSSVDKMYNSAIKLGTEGILFTVQITQYISHYTYQLQQY